MTKHYLHNPICSLLFALLFFSSCSGQAQTDKAAKLDELIGAYTENGKFNGSVLVAEDGEIIYSKGFGWANVEEKIPNKAETKHRLGSVTKQFTAMLILQLVVENKLKLHEPISTYLLDYPKETGDKITIHHLLTHSSGIPDYTSFAGYREMMDDHYSPEELVQLFADSPLEFPPGKEFRYSNSGYVLLGFIIEKMTGKTYEEVLQEKIFTPLGMNNTGVDHNDTELKNAAKPYQPLGIEFQDATYIDMSVPFSAGAIYSTVKDLFLWDQALYSEKLLPEKYLDLMFDKQIPADGQYYGYGWQIGNMQVGTTDEWIETISHSGAINGFNTLITRIPSRKTLIVLLNNAGFAPLYEMAVNMTGILHDQPYKFPKKSVAYSLAEMIEKDGIEKAISFYEEIKNSGDYTLDENEMNWLGYQLLWANKAKEAAMVFELIVDAFPNSSNAYDSYGEALLTLGDTTQAIINYQKSVELNPGNGNGLQVLERLGVNTDAYVFKVSPEDLKLLEGEYLNNDWKIEFKVVNGELTGNDKGYHYRLIPVGENVFINPDDNASLVFDTKDKDAITVTLFGTIFTKVM